MFADKIGFLDFSFKTKKECEDFFKSKDFVDLVKLEYGRDLPFLWEVKIKTETFYIQAQPEKQGIPMDWRFYAGFDPITKEDIQKETNIEKRRLLMMEYGIGNFFEELKVIQKDSYGELIETKIEGEKFRFMKVINGNTIEKNPEYIKYLQEKNMITKDNRKIYYIPTSLDVQTCKEAEELSFNLPKGSLPEKGWDWEC